MDLERQRDDEEGAEDYRLFIKDLRTGALGPDRLERVTSVAWAAGGRELLYYVRAIQEPTPAVNARGLRCEREGDQACARACVSGSWRFRFGFAATRPRR